MKFNLLGKYNQIEILKLDLTLEDIQVLDYILSVKDLAKFKRKYIEEENQMGVWIAYDTLIDELPVVFVKDMQEYLQVIKKLYELEQNAIKKGIDIKNDVEFKKQYKEVKDTYYTKYRKKVQRILKGSLANVIGIENCSAKKSDDCYKGKRVFFYIKNTLNLENLLLKNTNKNTYLEGMENIDNYRMEEIEKYNKEEEIETELDKTVREIKEGIINNIYIKEVTKNIKLLEKNIKKWLENNTKEEILTAINTIDNNISSFSYITNRLKKKMYKIQKEQKESRNNFKNFGTGTNIEEYLKLEEKIQQAQLQKKLSNNINYDNI